MGMNHFARVEHPYYDWYEREFKLSDSGWGEIVIHMPELIENDTVIVVLTYRRTVSAGESFVDSLRHLENVIVIGESTAGCTLTDARKAQLPNS